MRFVLFLSFDVVFSHVRRYDFFIFSTTVIKVIHSGSISACYCDFGEYTNLTLHQLIPLEAKFLELPSLAIKAKLSGIIECLISDL